MDALTASGLGNGLGLAFLRPLALLLFLLQPLRCSSAAPPSTLSRLSGPPKCDEANLQPVLPEIPSGQVYLESESQPMLKTMPPRVFTDPSLPGYIKASRIIVCVRRDIHDVPVGALEVRGVRQSAHRLVEP